LAPAYAAALRRAHDRNPTEAAGDLHLEAVKLGALDDVRSKDNQLYRATLKDVAYNLLRRNDYVKRRGSLPNLAAVRREAEDDLLELRAERVLVTRGLAGIEVELKRPGDPRYKAYLLDFRHRTASRTILDMDKTATELNSLIRLVDEESKRGLDVI